MKDVKKKKQLCIKKDVYIYKKMYFCNVKNIVMSLPRIVSIYVPKAI